jgi:hypothetical protein
MSLNLPNCQRLLDWLDAGAPDFDFDMEVSVCCIAGMAAFMHHGNSRPPHTCAWRFIEKDAQEFMGLPPKPIDLFDGELAPKNCTPAQAAQGLRNVMEGKPAWN